MLDLTEHRLQLDNGEFFLAGQGSPSLCNHYTARGGGDGCIGGGFAGEHSCKAAQVLPAFSLSWLQTLSGKQFSPLAVKNALSSPKCQLHPSCSDEGREGEDGRKGGGLSPAPSYHTWCFSALLLA